MFTAPKQVNISTEYEIALSDVITESKVKFRLRQNQYEHYTVTNDELFGIINPATREWKDGLFSVIMRDQANLVGDNAKWIILDGDIDPM